MTIDAGDAQFRGGMTDVYDQLLVPIIFEAPADSVARLVAGLSPADVLETAAGTGVLTRALVKACPRASITATDLSSAMLGVAQAQDPRSAAVTWTPADALDLPFADASFDVVVCQFGVMFFPDRVSGYREAARVLRPGGRFVLTVWDRIASNEVASVVESAMVRERPDAGLDFLSRVPHGYASADQIADDLAEAGMPGAVVREREAVTITSAADAARAFCQGTPLRSAIEGRSDLDLAEATATAERALLEHFGPGRFAAPIRWLEVVAEPRDGYGLP